MNVEIVAEAALFPEKEYINGITVAVWNMKLGTYSIAGFFREEVGFEAI
jgi:hypothetical protein